MPKKSPPSTNLCIRNLQPAGPPQTKQTSRSRSPLLNTRVSQKPPRPSFKGDHKQDDQYDHDEEHDQEQDKEPDQEHDQYDHDQEHGQEQSR